MFRVGDYVKDGEGNFYYVTEVRFVFNESLIKFPNAMSSNEEEEIKIRKIKTDNVKPLPCWVKHEDSSVFIERENQWVGDRIFIKLDKELYKNGCVIIPDGKDKYTIKRIEG